MEGDSFKVPRDGADGMVEEKMHDVLPSPLDRFGSEVRTPTP